jgi:hypothetical protein
MTMPKPGTNSLFFGTSGAFGTSFLSSELVVELVKLVEVLVEDVGDFTSVTDVVVVLCTVATEVAGVSVTVVVNAVMSCTITGSGGMIGASVTC